MKAGGLGRKEGKREKRRGQRKVGGSAAGCFCLNEWVWRTALSLARRGKRERDLCVGRPAAVDAVDAADAWRRGAEANAKTGRGPTAKLEPDHRASPPGLLTLQ
jgi:hypothetical protein